MFPPDFNFEKDVQFKTGLVLRGLNAALCLETVQAMGLTPAQFTKRAIKYYLVTIGRGDDWDDS